MVRQSSLSTVRNRTEAKFCVAFFVAEVSFEPGVEVAFGMECPMPMLHEMSILRHKVAKANNLENNALSPLHKLLRNLLV